MDFYKYLFDNFHMQAINTLKDIMYGKVATAKHGHADYKTLLPHLEYPFCLCRGSIENFTFHIWITLCIDSVDWLIDCDC